MLTVIQLNKRTSVPQNAIFCGTAFSALLGLISIGSPVAFQDLLSLTIAALYGSYFIACFGLLCRRIQGKIRLPEEGNVEHVNLPGSAGNLVWGPFRLPGIIGTIINIWACLYLAVVCFFCFWPTETPVTVSSMNYTVLVFGIVTILSTTYYVLWARKTFEGPVIETMDLALK